PDWKRSIATRTRRKAPGTKRISPRRSQPEKELRSRSTIVHPLTGGGALRLVPIFESHQDLPSLRTLVRPDDARFGHQIDEPRGACVPDTERALQQGGRAPSRLEDDAH